MRIKVKPSIASRIKVRAIATGADAIATRVTREILARYMAYDPSIQHEDALEAMRCLRLLPDARVTFSLAGMPGREIL